MDIIERLEEIKKTNEENKSERARLLGRLESLKEQMEKEYGCKTVEELKAKLLDIKEGLRTKEETIDTSIAEMEALLGID